MVAGASHLTVVCRSPVKGMDLMTQPNVPEVGLEPHATLCGHLILSRTPARLSAI